MIDVEKIVQEASDPAFCESMAQSARRSVALTLRAVAARCAELALHNYDNMEGCATAEEIDKWSTCMAMASDLKDELISKAAAIEKGGG